MATFAELADEVDAERNEFALNLNSYGWSTTLSESAPDWELPSESPNGEYFGFSVRDTDDEIPLYSEDAVIKTQWHIPQAHPNQEGLLSNQLKKFCPEVDVIFHTASDNEKWAVLKYMGPPELYPGKPLVNRAIDLKEPNGIVLGMFAGYKSAVIQTKMGVDTHNEVLDALNIFPNAQIVLAIGVAYGCDQAKIKYGDVLVSTVIHVVGNIKHAVSDGSQSSGTQLVHNVSQLLKDVFSTEKETDFEYMKNKRQSRVHSGVMISARSLMEMLDSMEAAVPEAIGGETEGVTLIEIQQKLARSREAPRNVSVMVIKGVANYADGDSEKAKQWQFTAALAAADYTHHKLKMTEGRLFTMMKGQSGKDDCMKAFENAVKTHQEVAFLMTQCVVFGPPNVGKTCLYYQLIGEKPPGTPTSHCQAGSGGESTDVLSDGKVIQVKIKAGRKQSTIVSNNKEWEAVERRSNEVALYMKTVKEQCTELHQSLHSGPSGEGNPQIRSMSFDSINSSSFDTLMSSSFDGLNSFDTMRSSFDTQSDFDTIQNSSFNASSSLPLLAFVPASSSTDFQSSSAHHIDSATAESRKAVTPTPTPTNEKNTFLKYFSGEEVDLSMISALSEESLTIFFSDCGGQPEFHEILPALVAGPTMFVLAFRLDIPLTSLYNIKYESLSSDFESYESSFSVKNVLMQCLSSISCFKAAQIRDSSSSTCSTDPPIGVLVVATHRDLVDDQTLQKINIDLLNSIEDTDLKKNGIIEMFDISKQQLIIPVDTYNHNDASTVREIFEQVIRRRFIGKNPFKVVLPANWLALMLSLRTLQVPIIKYSECIELAKKCHIPEDEVSNCLHYLHYKTGTIRYYSSVPELRDTVIVNPSVIFSAITQFITSTFSQRNLSGDICENFKFYGLFKESEVANVFEKQKDNLQISFKQCIALLKYLNIVGEPLAFKDLDYDYFFPCALAHAPKSEESQKIVVKDPLVVSFGNGFIPHGIYSGMLAQLCSLWQIKKHKQKPMLFRNQATFRVVEFKNIYATLRKTDKYLEMHLNCTHPSDAIAKRMLCPFVLKQFKYSLENACNKLGYCSEKSSFNEFKIGFYCDLCPADGDGNHHFAEVIDDEENRIRCAADVFMDVNEERQQWFMSTNKASVDGSVAISSNLEREVVIKNESLQERNTGNNVDSVQLSKFDGQEIPRFSEKELDEVVKDYTPKTQANQGTTLSYQIEKFCPEVDVILHTVRGGEKWAVLKYMDPPELHGKSLTDKSIDLKEPNGIVLGMFAGYKCAMIQTDMGADSHNEVEDALNIFPNAKVVLAIGVAYSCKPKKAKYGDVLVSKVIDGTGNIEYTKDGYMILHPSKTRLTHVSPLLNNVFAKGEETWKAHRHFECTTDGRQSKVYSGVMVSDWSLIDDKDRRNSMAAAAAEPVGGEMEGVTLVAIQQRLSKGNKAAPRNIGVAVIKGVASYADGNNSKEWQFTAAMAAADYTHHKLKMTEGKLFMKQDHDHHRHRPIFWIHIITAVVSVLVVLVGIVAVLFY